MLRPTTLFCTLLFAAAVTLAGCSPRNGFPEPAGGDDDDSASGLGCAEVENSWPTVLPEYADYEGDGANEGQFLLNFRLSDQHGEVMCLSQLLGHVLIVDASTRWCGPCNEAAAESAVLWEEMKEIGPSYITTLMVQNETGQPASAEDVTWWVEQYGIEYPVVLDNNQQTAADWAVPNYPLFFFVAPTGEIVQRIEQRPSETEVLEFVTEAVEDWADFLRPPD